MSSNKLFRSYGIILVLVILVMFLFELTKKPVTDWSRNFEKGSKSPFGLYILDQEAEALFKGKLIKTSTSPMFYEPKDSTQTRNYLFIENEISSVASEKILNEVEKGSTVMVIDDYFYLRNGLEEILAEFPEKRKGKIPPFGITTDYIYPPSDSIEYQFPLLATQTPLKLNHLEYGITVIASATENVKPLGVFKDKENEGGAFFVEIPYGKGKVYYFSIPEIFTNHGILYAENRRAIPKILGYLPDQETIWFQDREEDFSGEASPYEDSPLRVVFSNPPLRWAWRLLLLGLIIFMIFTAKRKQRIIPIIPPVKNESAEFVKNISNLYLQEGSAKDMAQKKAQYFLQKVRTELLIPTDKLDEKFIERLCIKTMQRHDTVQKATRLLQKAIHPQAPVRDDELIKMNKLLDQIYKS
uniref:DUF4350 domain-containing protein n=1 Tax=Ornithobacterium rhinotracheale TaxID=28251 RepID=UPI0039A4E210